MDQHVVITTPRWVRPVIAGMAFLMAVGFGVITWLILQRNVSLQQRQQLACQVQRLGGQPIGGVKCPPPKKATPKPTPTVTVTPGTKTTVIVVPSGGATVVRTVTPSPAPSTAPTRSPSSRPTHSPTPTPKPSTCEHVDGIASVCLTPPPMSFLIGTVWLWL